MGRKSWSESERRKRTTKFELRRAQANARQKHLDESQSIQDALTAIELVNLAQATNQTLVPFDDSAMGQFRLDPPPLKRIRLRRTAPPTAAESTEESWVRQSELPWWHR